MRIGIPKAFLYYKYRYLWETFFKELDCEVIVSPDTNKEILNRGAKVSIDESCLSSKIYLGHVEALIDKCDYILVPRIYTFGAREIVCTKFQAAYDVLKNVFKDRNIKLLDYNIDKVDGKTEFKAFMKLGKDLKKSKWDTMRAYYTAKEHQRVIEEQNVKQQNELLNRKDKLKILLVGHSYNIYDKYVGEPIIKFIKEQGCVPIIADIVDQKEAFKVAKEISPTLQWTYNKALVGAIGLYKDKVDGIILMTSFPCGPDSLVNELIIRKIKDKPIISLILDEQEGTAGQETRIESFVDIIKLKNEERRKHEHEKTKS